MWVSRGFDDGPSPANGPLAKMALEPATMSIAQEAPADRQIHRGRLADRLTREPRAEIVFDPGQRRLYATDASLYQIDPLGVVIPRTVEDVARTVHIAADLGVPVLPR